MCAQAVFSLCRRPLIPGLLFPALHLSLLSNLSLWTLMGIFPSPYTLSSPPCHLYFPATRRKLMSVLPDPPGPFLAHRLIAPSPTACKTLCLPLCSHGTHPLLSSPSPVPLPRHAHSLPSSEAIRMWARSHGCVSKLLGKSWIL